MKKIVSLVGLGLVKFNPGKLFSLGNHISYEIQYKKPDWHPPEYNLTEPYTVHRRRK